MAKQGDSQNTILTYSPYIGAVVDGDQSNFVFNNPGAQMHIASVFKASLKRVVTAQKYPTFDADVNVKADSTTGYLRV